jgi:replication-associated recombination protein RarA
MPLRKTGKPWAAVTSKRGYAADELIATLQKSIRRGDTELALLVAREMYETSARLEEKLWSRLCVISCEDTGDGSFLEPVIVNALYQMHERLDRAFGDRWLFVVHVVRFLAGRTKDRSSDEHANITMHMINTTDKPFEIPEYALDVHTRRGRLAGRDAAHFWSSGSHVENERPGRDHALLERIRALVAGGEWRA